MTTEMCYYRTQTIIVSAAVNFAGDGKGMIFYGTI